MPKRRRLEVSKGNSAFEDSKFWNFLLYKRDIDRETLSTLSWDMKNFIWLCRVPIFTAYGLIRPFSLGFYSLFSGQLGDQEFFKLQTFLCHISYYVGKLRSYGKANEELWCQPAPGSPSSPIAYSLSQHIWPSDAFDYLTPYPLPRPITVSKQLKSGQKSFVV